jgi:hypothetical protein
MFVYKRGEYRPLLAITGYREGEGFADYPVGNY